MTAPVDGGAAKVSLYREIDALGGVPDPAHQSSVGYCQAIADVLAILDRRGFSEFADAPGEWLRDHFAGQVIGAVVRQCANDAAFGYPEGVTSIEQMFAAKAYALADAMLAARVVQP